MRVTIDGSNVRVADRRFSYFDTALGIVVSSPFILALGYIVLNILCELEGCRTT